jgi:hypothetical protein
VRFNSGAHGLFEKTFMDARLAKFSDRQIAQMLGTLNTGRDCLATRLICEASYRLARAGGPAMTEDEDELIEQIMTMDYRLREIQRRQRRSNSVRKGGLGESPEPLPVRRLRTANASTSLRLVVKK